MKWCKDDTLEHGSVPILRFTAGGFEPVGDDPGGQLRRSSGSRWRPGPGVTGTALRMATQSQGGQNPPKNPAGGCNWKLQPPILALLIAKPNKK